jgi:hypothetical protein
MFGTVGYGEFGSGEVWIYGVVRSGGVWLCLV